MNIIITEKKCARCNRVKPLTCFSPDKRKKDGLYSSCKDCCNEYTRKHPEISQRWYKENTDLAKHRARKHDLAHPERRSGRHKRYVRKLRTQIIKAYGGKCACCSEERYEFLCVDHINGGGNEERKKMGGQKLYRFIRDEGYPDRYQILCHNCNMSKGFYGYCPHENE